MGIDMKGKLTTAAGETLVNAGGTEKLSGTTSEPARILTDEAGRAASSAAQSVGNRLTAGGHRKQKISESHQAAANRVLLHEQISDTYLNSTATQILNKYKPDTSGGTLHTGDGHAKFSRKKGTVGDKTSVPEAKLHDNSKKLQKKLRAQYEIKTKAAGGVKTDLRVEQTATSKLRDGKKFAGTGAAVSFGRSALRMTNRMADDPGGSGAQGAWIDAAGKAESAVSKVYSVSQTAKSYRTAKKQEEITKLLKKEDKLVKKGLRNQYHSALKIQKQGALWQQSNFYDRYLQKKAIKRKYMKNAMKEYQNAKKAAGTAKVTYTTGFNVFDKAKQGAGKLWEAVKSLFSSSIGKIAIVGTVILALIMAIIGAAGPLFLMSFGGDSEFSSGGSSGGGFPAEVLAWRQIVTERCEANNDTSSGIDLNDYVNAILAIIWQESGGVSSSCDGDIMQCKESGMWIDANMPTEWGTEEKSIDVGVRCFYEAMKLQGVTGADDYDGLQMAAQAYNYGFGFLYWAQDKGYTKWDSSMSSEYSEKMKSELGVSSYGHKTYGSEWLTKYQSGGMGGSGAIVEETGSGGVIKTAQNQIGITEDPVGSNNVIFNTEYYGKEVSGDDYPWCCVFVWWCFNKSGNGAAFYDGDKVAGCGAVYSWAQRNRLFITGSEATYGDIVLFGSNEHIEIVVSNNGDGTYTTIGGNTSASDGSQSNGGCVALKTRYTTGSFPITSFIRPQYDKVE